MALAIWCSMAYTAYGQSPSYYYVSLATDKGEGVIKLYNETPIHRDNFVRLVKEGFYDSLLFHRVIEHFMIQGGDPTSRYAAKGQPLGSGGAGERLTAEFHQHLIHKRGALGAARDNNPEKASSPSQFYIVQGRTFSAAGLDSLEEFRLKRKMTDLQRKTYQSIGGAPHLDGAYTVFGELVRGIELVDRIAKVETDDRDRPLEDVHMYMRLLNTGEALDIELGPDGPHRHRSFFKRLFGKKLTGHYTVD